MKTKLVTGITEAGESHANSARICKGLTDEALFDYAFHGTGNDLYAARAELRGRFAALNQRASRLAALLCRAQCYIKEVGTGFPFKPDMTNKETVLATEITAALKP